MLSHRRNRIVLFAIVLISIMTWSDAQAQGNIFGSVKNSNMSTPADGEISFVGYLDDTDEEIRIETSTGAGYDNGNWFDDFQNFLTEAPGNPYDYIFHNNTNSEGYILSDVIPNNSFQQEDINLSAVEWPQPPANVSASALADGKVVLSWTTETGNTAHVYRRPGSSSGSFFRIDNPTGSLADPGVSGYYFTDTGVDGISLYDYLIIIENSSGQWSPHSIVTTVASDNIVSPEIADISPSRGDIDGGTAITITGDGFDPDGVEVLIGSTSLNDIDVVSPYEIRGTTPPGSTGSEDITVTNLESGLSDNVLSGFTYYVNTPPGILGVGNKNGLTETLLTFTLAASDADGDEVFIDANNLPVGATLTYNGFNPVSGNYESLFEWIPGPLDGGLYDNIEILAYDADDTTAKALPIRIFDNGYVCGDANGDWEYNLLDIIYLISYIYDDPQGPAPMPVEAGDANGDSAIDLLDILYLIPFLYDDPPGPAPLCP